MVQALRLSHISAKSPHNSGGFPCPQMALSFLSCHAAGEAQASSRTVAHEAFTRKPFFVKKISNTVLIGIVADLHTWRQVFRGSITLNMQAYYSFHTAIQEKANHKIGGIEIK